jgi:hypothetical protein
MPGGTRPVIPRPPPRDGRRQTDRGWLLWPIAFGLGATLGIVAYHWIGPVQSSFDYWLALLLR